MQEVLQWRLGQPPPSLLLHPAIPTRHLINTLPFFCRDVAENFDFSRQWLRRWSFAAPLLPLCALLVLPFKALQAVKSSFIDPMKNLSTWNSRDPCIANWTGVFCFNESFNDGYLHLRKLELMRMNLSGTLPPEVGLFSRLRILTFMWNNIGGSIPKEIGNLTNLELLLLNGNQLTGSLPDEIGFLPNLRRLQIDQNKISGSIPKSFANLNKTKHFHMNNNSISGEIPLELFRLPSLIHFLLDNNNLSGSLPAEFSKLPNLMILQLDNNNFSGSEIPASFANMTKLVKLSLRNCSLQGSIPDFSRIANMSYIDLSLNQLSGPIPTEKLSENMTTIILSHNILNETIPQNLASLPRLQKLSLGDYLLSGSVPSTLWESRSTTAENLTLDFRNNKLTEIAGSSSVPANVTLLLEGNPICSNNSIGELYCGSWSPDNNTQDMTNSTTSCPSLACPRPYEYAPLALMGTCYCAAPLLIYFRLKSPGFSDFLPYQSAFEEYLTSELSLKLEQLNISSIVWQEGPRLKMDLMLFPVYDNATQNNLFKTTEVRRLWRMITGWEVAERDNFGPYELLDFILLDPYKSVFSESSSSSGLSKGALSGIIIGAIAGVAILLTIVSLFIAKKYSRKKKASKIPSIIEGVRGFTYEEMAHATSNFSSGSEVGQGGYGRVYKGTLADGGLVAIKRAEGSLQGVKEFYTEIEVLSKLHHRYLVSLIGYCDEKGEQMLVYEFMPNGALRDHISVWSDRCLRFATRLRIALESARGILYLHAEAHRIVFHRDIKSNNILLDSKFTAKVADFGLSRLVPVSDTQGNANTHLSTAIKGTPGYVDPEYFMTQQFSDKSDVYSLGVVFLELLTGMQAITFGRHIVQEVTTSYQSGDIFSVVDERMGAYPRECVERFASLALRCCQDKGVERPTMAEVVRELESITQMIPESDARSATESSSNNQTRASPSSSSPATRDPYVSFDASGSNLVSGTFPSIPPR